MSTATATMTTAPDLAALRAQITDAAERLRGVEVARARLIREVGRLAADARPHLSGAEIATLTGWRLGAFTRP